MEEGSGDQGYSSQPAVHGQRGLIAPVPHLIFEGNKYVGKSRYANKEKSCSLPNGAHSIGLCWKILGVVANICYHLQFSGHAGRSSYL